MDLRAEDFLGIRLAPRTRQDSQEVNVGPWELPQVQSGAEGAGPPPHSRDWDETFWHEMNLTQAKPYIPKT
jgi:hypothetical protein